MMTADLWLLADAVLSEWRQRDAAAPLDPGTGTKAARRRARRRGCCKTARRERRPAQSGNAHTDGIGVPANRPGPRTR
jgi:hypothetical protein